MEINGDFMHICFEIMSDTSNTNVVVIIPMITICQHVRGIPTFMAT